MFKLPVEELEQLRDRLQVRGQRPSMVIPESSRDVAEAIAVVEEYGGMCEAMYLMMAADRRVRNVEREVLRGALDILSEGRVRTAHMEAMLDASCRRVAEHGEDECLKRITEALGRDSVRAEITVILAAAVAAADGEVCPEEHALLGRLAAALHLDETRARRVLEKLSIATQTPQRGERVAKRTS
jgi:tellurite resistance protein